MRHGDGRRGQKPPSTIGCGDQVHDGPLAFDEARQLKGHLRRQGLVVGTAAKIELKVRAPRASISQPARKSA